MDCNPNVPMSKQVQNECDILLLLVQVTPCKLPPNITDGSIIYYVYDEYPHGEQVEYKCNIKFAMTGLKIVECIDGEWTPLPSCTGKCLAAIHR